MRVQDSKLYVNILKTYKIKNGYAHFFKNFYIVEMNEGVLVDYNNSNDLINLVDLHFGTEVPFGIISNRINSYSINLLDTEKFKSKHQNAIAKAIVSYSDSTTKFINLENYFCEFNRQEFKDLHKAVYWVEKEIKQLQAAI